MTSQAHFLTEGNLCFKMLVQEVLRVAPQHPTIHSPLPLGNRFCLVHRPLNEHYAEIWLHEQTTAAGHGRKKGVQALERAWKGRAVLLLLHAAA